MSLVDTTIRLLKKPFDNINDFIINKIKLLRHKALFYVAINFIFSFFMFLGYSLTLFDVPIVFNISVKLWAMGIMSSVCLFWLSLIPVCFIASFVIAKYRDHPEVTAKLHKFQKKKAKTRKYIEKICDLDLDTEQLERELNKRTCVQKPSLMNYLSSIFRACTSSLGFSITIFNLASFAFAPTMAIILNTIPLVAALIGLSVITSGAWSSLCITDLIINKNLDEQSKITKKFRHDLKGFYNGALARGATPLVKAPTLQATDLQHRAMGARKAKKNRLLTLYYNKLGDTYTEEPVAKDTAPAKPR